MNNKLTIREYIVVVFFSFLTGIYAPYELYITNSGEWWFSLKHFLPYCLIVFMIMVSVMLTILRCINGKLRDILIGVILGMEVSIYFQGTFLNIDIGKLTGLTVEFKKYSAYYIRDMIVWCVIFIIMFAIYAKSQKVFDSVATYLPMFMMIMLLLTSVVLLTSSFETEMNKRNTTTFDSKRGLSTLGNEENIVVFLLDMFDSRYLKAICEEHAESLNDFDGFVVYDNYTGGYATTSYSLAFMNAGEYFRNEQLLDEFVNSRDSYVDSLLEDGYDVANYGAYGFPGRLYGHFSNYIEGKMGVRNPVKFMFHIYEMAAFRYAPNIMKTKLMSFQEKLNADMIGFAEYDAYSDSNIDIYNSFLNTTMTVESGKKFKFIYAKGVHYPYVNDSDMNEVPSNDKNPVECALGCLKMVDKYIEDMKENGVYDNSTIIITSDHGYFSDYGMDQYTKPIMMIKTKGSSGEIKHRSAPVGHKDFAATIEGIVTGKVENKFGKSILAYNDDDERLRFYYHYYLKEKGDARRLIEFEIKNDSNADDAFVMTGNEYTVNGDVINHEKYCKSCQTGNHDGKGKCWHEKASNYP